MMPLGPPLHKLRSQSSIRTISLTPPEISINYILDHIVADVIIGTTTGFRIVDANGNHSRIRLEVPEFVGYYPDSPEWLNL